jgi:hypothetical protein
MQDLRSGPIAEVNSEDEIRELDGLLRRASEYLPRAPQDAAKREEEKRQAA